MRLIRLSLAAKYRMLFGVAVLLIIGVALLLPWKRAEDLAEEQPFREARRAADDYFRLVLAERPQGSEASAGHAGMTGPAGMRAGGVHQLSLLPDIEALRPLFVPIDLANANAQEISGEGRLGTFALKALRKLGSDPTDDFYYESGRQSGERHYFYAAPVRIAARCLECHGEGKTARRYAENELAGVIAVAVPVDKDATATLVNRGIIVAAGALAGFLAILVFYVITHRFILSPIDELREVARRVTEGDIDVRSTLRTGDEFEQLAESFNAMLERLRATEQELRGANRSLDLKLGEMAETNVSLYESNRLKTEFLANVSHELRTPLTSIIGFAELLRDADGVEANGKAARYAENILISGRILLEIINDLLDLAKIEAGKVDLHIGRVRLEEVCGTLMDFMRPLADKKRIALKESFEPDLPELESDRGRLRQILFNLLSNAIKFTHEGGRVEVRLRRAGADAVRLEVLDNGPGIDPKHHALIFEKFRQIDGSATREYYGTGLGLPIAKELVALLGGRIGVESRLAEGATFWVELPVGAPVARDRPMVSLV